MKLAFRAAAILIALFCGGHTVGTLVGRAPDGPASAVLATMRTVRFDFNGSDRSFYEIFLGHALIVSLYLAASALVAWMLSSSEAARWRVLVPIAWGLVLAQGATAAITWAYFFVGPAVITSLATALLVVGMRRAPRIAASSGTTSS